MYLYIHVHVYDIYDTAIINGFHNVEFIRLTLFFCSNLLLGNRISQQKSELINKNAINWIQRDMNSHWHAKNSVWGNAFLAWFYEMV